MKKTRNKVTVLLLTLVMLVTMLGVFALTASAADDLTVEIDTGASAVASLTTAGDAPVVTYYTTLEEALAAAESAEGSTVTLLADCTSTESARFEITAGEFTIDLNGHKLLTQTNTSLLVSGGNIILTDDNAEPGGATGIISIDGGSLTVNGGVYEMDVRTTGGDLMIENGSFHSAYTWNEGTLTVKGGSFGTLEMDGNVGTLADVLPKHYYIYGSDGTIINPGNVECDAVFNTYTVENVTVKQGAGEPADEGLSGGAVAGVVCGSAGVVGIGGFAIFWFVIKKKNWSDLVAVFKKK